jgi:hypothetical protein
VSEILLGCQISGLSSARLCEAQAIAMKEAETAQNILVMVIPAQGFKSNGKVEPHGPSEQVISVH